MDDEDLGTADVRISPDEAIYVYSGDDFGYVERYICEGDVCVLELEAYEGTRSFAVSQIERDETGVPSEIRDVHFEVTLDEVTSINDYRNEPVELLECSALVLEQ